MDLDAIAVGRDPPREVNVVVEVPVGGYEPREERHSGIGDPSAQEIRVDVLCLFANVLGLNHQ